jgi:capsular polysaccharide biosynthesis protein
MTTSKRQTLQRKLREVEAAIVETEKRLPAHSVKPPVMHDLLALEDERDSLLKQLDELQADE